MKQSLEASSRSLTEENERLKASLASYESTQKDHLAKLTSLESSIASLQASRDKDADASQSEEVSIDALRSALTAAETAKTQANEAVARMTAELAASEAARASAETRANAAEKEASAAVAQSAQLLADIQTVKRENVSLRARAETSVAAVVDGAKMAQLSELLTLSRRRIEVLEAAVSSERRRVMSLESQVVKKEGSVGWSGSEGVDGSVDESVDGSVDGSIKDEPSKDKSMKDKSRKDEPKESTKDKSIDKSMKDTSMEDSPTDIPLASTLLSLRQLLHSLSLSLTQARAESLSLQARPDPAPLLASLQQRDSLLASLRQQTAKTAAKHHDDINRLENTLRETQADRDAVSRQCDDLLHQRQQMLTDIADAHDQLAQMKRQVETAAGEAADVRKLLAQRDATIAAMAQDGAKVKETLLVKTQALAAAEETVQSRGEAVAAAEATAKETAVRFTAEMEALSRENVRIRDAAEAAASAAEKAQNAANAAEAQLAQWKEGMAASLRQKRVLKRALREVAGELAGKEESARKSAARERALERAAMEREDMASSRGNAEESFGGFEWCRKLTRYLARHSAAWNEYSEEVPAIPEEAAIPVIANTIETLEWKEEEKKYLLNWMDFFAHGGMIDNGDRFAKALQIQGVTFDVGAVEG